MNTVPSKLSLVLLSALLACSGSGADPSPADRAAADPAPAASGSHAPADAAVGSHADWCGEHAVPESQCTRCNAALIPAFQATGDWCPEHGLPESHCLQCNPELKIERPPKDG